MTEVHAGWFIRFGPDEKDFEADLIDYLRENDYPEDAEGIKKLLSDTIYMEEEQSKSNPIMDAIRENPEAVKNAFAGLGNLASQVINKKIFKR